MSNLLDKSSIILTPTAYNNGEALCVKPSDGSGDFDFSRNSAATRVNAQGLVENVQILSSNLVQNPSFSEEGVQEVSNGSFSQEGSELITNGDFSSDTDWTKGTGWSIGGGTANCDGTQTSNSSLRSQTFVVGSNPTLKLTFDVVNYSSGLLAAGITGTGQADITNINANGTYSVIVVSSTGNRLVDFVADADFIGSIENCSVREVGQDWNLGSGWSIAEDKAVATNSASGQKLRQAGQLTASKTYKLVYEVTELTLGGFLPIVGAVQGTAVYSIGTYTEYITTTNDDFYIRTLGTTSGSITNISVKEVGMDWVLFSGWSIGNDKVVGDGTAFTDVSQTPILIQNKKVKLTFDVLDYVSGTFRIPPSDRQDGLDERFSGNGSYEVIYTSTVPYFRFQQQALAGSITNISVIEITTDTNLPRINYEGFSYQDVLGSEQIVNGSFESNSNWSMQASWSIANGSANFDGLASHYIQQSNVFAANTNYKLTFTISNNTSGIISIRDGAAAVLVPNTNYSNGTYTFYITSTANTSLKIFGVGGSGSLSIDNVSVKEVTGQEVVPNSGCGSWLWEPQSTNLIPYSEDFSQWNVIGAPTITSNYGISPDGTQNSTRIQFNNSDRIYESVSVSGDITYSVYLKGVGEVRLRDNAGIYTLDITLTDQWVRYEYSFNGTITNVQIQQAVGTSDLEIWGAQVEALSYPTSLIPTSGSTVTRNQDVCNNGGSLATINSTSGVLYAEIAALSLGSSASLGLNDGSGANRVLILLQSNGDIRGFVASNNTIVFDEIYSGISTLNNNKVAVSYKLNQFSLWINGTKRFTDTIGNTPIGLNQLDFDNGSGASNFFGKTKAVAVWKEALSDAELTELTTI